jgi:hypothetical protein
MAMVAGPEARLSLAKPLSPLTPATYDARGCRKGKTIDGVTTNFLYDGHSVVQELSGGSVQANLLLGVGIDEGRNWGQVLNC